MSQGKTGHYLGLGPKKSLRPLCVWSRGPREGVKDPLVIMMATLESLEPAPGGDLSGGWGVN